MMHNARGCKAKHDQSFWAHEGQVRTQTLVRASAVFISFWAQHGPPGAETLVNA